MSDTIERVKIAKLLLCQDQGLVGKNHGRNLEEITLEGMCHSISYLSEKLYLCLNMKCEMEITNKA